MLSRHCPLALLILAGILGPAFPREPVIRNITLRGLEIGGTTSLVLDGDELGPSPRLLLPFPAQQTLKPGSTDKRIAFDVALGEDVQAGYHHLRVVTDQGVSLPIVIGVDRLKQIPMAPTCDKLPAALHGTAAGSKVEETQFTGKKGQKIQVEVEAQRLGSKLRPVLHLYNSRKLQIAWSWPQAALDGDTRLEATLPEDGTYSVTLHDTEYAAPGGSIYRLKIGQWSYINLIFPPVVGKGMSEVELVGDQWRKIKVQGSGTSVVALDWPGKGNWSGPRPFVRVSPLTEIVEQPRMSVLQLPAGPLGVSGRLLAPFEEDHYRLPVIPKTKVRLEVFSERLGSPLDVALVLFDEKGKQLARGEDSPGSLDPVLDYNVPDKVTSLEIGIVDAQGRGCAQGVYRLVVEPQSTQGPAGFALLTPAQKIALPETGFSVVPIWIERQGYEGPVEITAQDLPTGVKLTGTTIPAEAEGTLVTLQRTAGSPGAAITRWIGKTKSGEVQQVYLKGHPLERLQPWLATELALANTAAQSADFQIEWRNLPTDAKLIPAGKLPLPVKIQKKQDGIVKLTLLTSQMTPVLNNNQPDPKKALRQEKAVEIPVKVSEGEVVLLVAPELAGASYDLTIQAELLTPDKKTVLASAFTPVRRLEVQHPLVVQLPGPPRLEVALDKTKGGTLKIEGKIQRQQKTLGEVTVTLAGLPGGLKAAPVTLKAGQEPFAIVVAVPPNQPTGFFDGIKLSASAAVDPKQPTVRVKGRDVDLTLVVK